MVLVVEDDPEVRQMLLDLLRGEGYRVTTVDEPEVIVTTARTVRPDLFLVDIMLHGTSGFEVLHDLRDAGFTDTPVIAMTASNVLALYAREAGTFEAVAEKPFDIDALIGLIKGSLGFGPSEQ